MEIIEKPKLPKTLEEREALNVTILRIPATLEDFFALEADSEYRLEYYNQDIVSIMGQASLPHESLVANLIFLLNQHFFYQDDYNVYSSNIKIYIDECQSAFNADLTVVKGKPESYVLKSNKQSTATITNPEIIVEILSDSTRDFDFGSKLNCYKTMPTLSQVIFVDQARVYISSYSRTETPHQWLNEDFFSTDEKLKIAGFEIAISEIYRKVPVLK